MHDDSPLPVELVVLRCSDQGLRQPGKVARIYHPGYGRLLAQLEKPRLVGLQREWMALTGYERYSGEQPTGYAQTWVCHFSPPFDLARMRVSRLLENGVQQPKYRIDERGWEGHVKLSQRLVPELGRQAFVASLITPSGSLVASLLDADIDWIGRDRFALEGTGMKEAVQDVPETHYEGGWLCSFWAAPAEVSGRRYDAVKERR